MKNILIVLTLLIAGAVFGAAEREYLWPRDKMPDRQAHQVATTTDRREKETEPYIEWYDVPAEGLSTDAVVILISGGSYNKLCDITHIRRNWPEALSKAGVRCVNLVYRSPRPKGLPFYQSAWEDGQRAVRLVRSQAEKRGFDPEKIGVMSMSAGSHLALLLATSSQTPAYEKVDALDEIPCHINWATTFAIAFALTDGLGVPNTQQGEGEGVALDSCFKFDEKTCPMFMAHGGKDQYAPTASTQVYRELRKRKIPAEVHLYADKGHRMLGLGRAIEFMRRMGFIGKLEKKENVMARYPDDDARAEYEKADIWPEGKSPDAQAEQEAPYLEWHMPKKLKTKAIQIIWSGGSYKRCGTDTYEVAPVRRFLNEKGMTVVTVRYRTPRPAKPLAKHVSAWQDAQRVIRLVRAEAEARGLDPNRIGVMGSSAGGHLALMCATTAREAAYAPIDAIDEQSAAVQWAVCFYPAYALTDGANGGNKTGGNDDSAKIVREFAFDADTPPMLFLHGDADKYAAMNSVKVWERLRSMGIQGELHTLARETHCFQREAHPGTGAHNYLNRIWDFLSAKGFTK